MSPKTKATTAVLNIFDPAIEAAAKAMYLHDYPARVWSEADDEDQVNYWHDAELMILAGLPHIREAIAREVDSLAPADSLMAYVPDFMTGVENAARIVRGER